MKYLKFPRLLHDGEIHSIDVSKHGDRLITGGKDCSVVVWSCKDFEEVYKKLEANQDISEELSRIQPLSLFKNHTSVVNILKWSPSDNDVFVSSDISGEVFINKFSEATSEKIHPFGLSTTLNGDEIPTDSETREFYSIIDIALSQDGRLLACSTSDGKVYIYDTTRKTRQDLTTLISSEKLIIQRSLSFDPTNNLLITLNDDSIIYIYQFQYEENTQNYKFRLIHKISKMINKSVQNVQYKRISWSSDGEFISIPTATKNTTSLVSLLSRSKNWQNKISLVGHDISCEVVDFNPRIYQANPNEHQIFHVIATAGSDKTLVVWNTTKDSPILILQNVADKPIVDLAWNTSGKTLYSASLDGSLSLYFFEEGDLGKEVDEATFKELMDFKDVYLKPFTFKYEKDQPAGNKKSGSQAIEVLDQKDASSIHDIKMLQNGKDDDIKPVNSESNESKEIGEVHKEETKSDLVPEVIVPSQTPQEATEVDALLTAMENREVKSSPKKSKTPSHKEKPLPVFEKSKVTTKNGKKRVQPTLISKNGSSNEVKEPLRATPSKTDLFQKGTMEFDKPSYSVSEDTFRLSKRAQSADESHITKKAKRELEPVKFIGSVILNPNTTFSKVRLSVPKIRLGFQLQKSDKIDYPLVLDVRNGSGNETKPSRISCFKNDKLIWSDFVPKFIQLAAQGGDFWALSTADGQVLVYSAVSGRRCIPPMVLGTPLSFLESHNEFLLAVTSVGELFVWDIEKRRVNLTASLSPLLDIGSKLRSDGLSKSDNITMCSVASMGIPLITLSNGSGYLYNKNLGTWQTITESWWAFGSHYWDSNEDSSRGPQSFGIFGSDSSIIGLLEHKTNDEVIRKTRIGRGKYFNKISKNMIMKEGFENLENTVSLSHLENRILCSEILGEINDFKRFLITYVKRICELGLKVKLFEICDQLLGSSGETKRDQWNSKICGLDKHELLKEIIIACSDHRDSQRVLVHFGKKMGLITDDIDFIG